VSSALPSALCSPLIMNAIFKILFFLWAATIFILSFYTPVWLHIDPPFQYPDKWKHVIGSFVLALLLYTAFPRVSIWKSLFLWITITTFFEFLQPFITGGHRQFEWLDILMNSIGFTMGLLIFNSKKILKSVRSKQFL
jgi:VanZ family protein